MNHDFESRVSVVKEHQRMLLGALPESPKSCDAGPRERGGKGAGLGLSRDWTSACLQ